ncbi:hypothetical protein [Adhaeribacter radiodurans]|uniref:STAS/SEC14 domain-containing protein n=1 Tax=Adhaeribacter radiodurans TaxID=2745197 RepID=A0A7L7L8L9_9BACT|nr:hypothetical protein [Adhaeribacter radiodurans]QMU29167.1 hypothetical protein HUW48_14460 [Adhaeribacter radiodurans]
MVYNFNFKELTANEVVQIKLNPQLSYLYLFWKQHPNSEQFRNAYRLGVYLALKYNIKYWLADAQHMTYLAGFDQSWLTTKMHPLLKSGKLIKYAIIMSPDCFLMTQHKPNSASSTEKQPATRSDNFHLFMNEEEACSWLFKGTTYSHSYSSFIL